MRSRNHAWGEMEEGTHEGRQMQHIGSSYAYSVQSVGTIYVQGAEMQWVERNILGPRHRETEGGHQEQHIHAAQQSETRDVCTSREEGWNRGDSIPAAAEGSCAVNVH